MDTQRVKSLLHGAFPGAEIEVIRDDHEHEKSQGAHFGLIVTSEEFDGMSRIDRHRAVHDVLGDSIGEEIHAVEIRAQTPEEAQKG